MSGFEGAGDASLLYVVGTDQPEKLKVEGNTFSLGGTTDLYKLLGKKQRYHRLRITHNYVRHPLRVDLAGYTHILNLITEPEDNGRVLDNLRKLVRGHPAKVVNRPEAVMRSTRDQVARQLAGIAGLHVPRAIRLRGSKPAHAARQIEKAGLAFPVILRKVGTHTGRIVGLFDSADGVARALEGDGDYVATEFVDFVSPDGLYRKYRAFFIGPHIIFRHMLVSESWNVHAKDRARVMAERPSLLKEEEALFERPNGAFPPDVHETLEAVRKRMGLDYFGIDFGLLPDGRVLLFEANATMNFFPFMPDPRFDYVKRCEAPARQALRELLGLPAERPTE